MSDISRDEGTGRRGTLARLKWPVASIGVAVAISTGLRSAGITWWATPVAVAAGCALGGWFWARDRRREAPTPVGPESSGAGDSGPPTGPDRGARLRLTILFSEVIGGRIHVDALVSVDDGAVRPLTPQPISLLLARPRNRIGDALVVGFIEDWSKESAVVDLVLKGRGQALLAKDEASLQVDLVDPLPRITR